MRYEEISLEEYFQELKNKIMSYNPNYDFWTLDKAFNFSVVAHSGQKRVSVEPYITHPL